MRLTIIPADKAVYKDGVMKAWAAPALDLSGCGIPANCHALQWYDTYGEIEFNPVQPGYPQPPNEQITELPQWALNCVAVWDAWVPAPPPPPPPPPPESQPTTEGAQSL
jgi:hypothetical protein